MRFYVHFAKPRRHWCLLMCVFAAAAVSLTIATASSSAYEGTFCYEELRAEGAECSSVERANIRRAIGHVTDSYVYVEISTTAGTKTAQCYEYYGCQANTGYLASDGTGRGYVWNEGPNGERRTYGYLYP